MYLTKPYILQVFLQIQLNFHIFMNYLELQFDALQRHKPGGTSRVKRLSNRDHDEVKQMMFDKFVKARNYFVE